MADSINIKPSHEGAFTKKAKAAGKSVAAMASSVLSAPEGKYSAATRKQANFARNASKWNHGGNKQLADFYKPAPYNPNPPKSIDLKDFMNPLAIAKKRIREDKMRIGDPQKEAQLMQEITNLGTQA